MTFAENIRKFRTARGLTQEALGEQVGLSGQAVSKWETSDTYPDPTLLPTLADALGVTVDALFGHEVHSKERLSEDFAAMLRDTPAEDRTRLRFEVLAALFRTAFGGGAASVNEPDERSYHQIDTHTAAGFLSENEDFPFLVFGLEPPDGWESICRDERLPGFLAAIGDPDVLRCVLWIFGHEPKPIEGSLLVKRAGADPSRTDEILEKLVKIGAIGLETYVINGRERIIADTNHACGIYFKGPMRSFLSAARVLTSCKAGTHYHENNSDPPFLK
ncbi:MAG: helix-turn-helix transcriptional regulator [Clostridiales bacterium]|nr:helix-turn-helix transcriptional regulator [Clostridiales bacterium]